MKKIFLKMFFLYVFFNFKSQRFAMYFYFVLSWFNFILEMPFSKDFLICKISRNLWLNKVISVRIYFTLNIIIFMVQILTCPDLCILDDTQKKAKDDGDEPQALAVYVNIRNPETYSRYLRILSQYTIRISQI